MTAAASAAPWIACAQPEGEPPAEGGDVALGTQNLRSSHVTIPVSINGQGPYQLIVDTGSSASCLAGELAQRLALPPGPRVRVTTLAGVRPRNSVLVDRLEIGAKIRRRVRAPVLANSAFGADGVLGIDWLKGQRLVLGFKAQRMEITRSREETSRTGQVVVPARRKAGQLTIVDADLAGDPIHAIIDSGSEVSLGNKALRALVGRRERIGALQPVGMITIAGERFNGEGGYLSFIRLGGLQLGNVPVVYADSHVFAMWDLEDKPALMIGMDLLRQFDMVALDFGRSAVRFDFPEAKGVLGP